MRQGALEVAAPRGAGNAGAGGARIGPNSVLQLVPVLDAQLGPLARHRLLASAGLRELPPDDGLMPEEPAAALHQALRRQYPAQAAELAREAGERTGDYILAHRIPPIARQVIRKMPSWLAAPILASSIEKHAWTFAGSGRFRVVSRQPLVFELVDNPVVRGEHADRPLCDWHAAVFQRLFNVLVDKHMKCVETQCCATGAESCRFTLT
ncbi:bacteriochlorophyll 4-vinyl reductase [Pseudohaliea rubra]|uniref:Protein BchJ, involved in reduction of C-8 vinyl of divinyl protochlorophyllide n=1 Tax=Pseudohaliea rubra DSM 19751 TaxID=1265313 RepID=A0A095VP53_9GAMM|nr:bacteriochlorophyll 4-vinyl reductase [Pseudohaliea rubra]KGE02903.1 Protein BchJ, involved in reduction of C-8 vinyl of divinyl protochlorophyllide [Pseudohaliea rubra DSM 19751]